MRLETSSYYALGVPLFGALMAIEALVARRRRVAAYRLADDLGSLACGMGQLLAGIFIGPLMLALYEVGFGMRIVTMPTASPLTWAFAFVGVDLCYYFYHRASHRLALLWTVHGVHHQSDGLNFAVALRQPYVSDLYAIFFYFPLPLLGVPEPVFFAVIAILSVNQVTLHTRVFSRASLGIFNTPALHELHHAKDAPGGSCNFGATLIVWDKIFDTYAPARRGVAPELGTAEGYVTHDSVLAQWRGFSDLAARVRGASGAREIFATLLGPPAAPLGATSSPVRARESARVPRDVRRRVLAQFVMTTVVALACLWGRAHLGAGALVLGTALVLFSYHCAGRLLDGAPHAVALDRARVAIVGAIGLALVALPSHRIEGAVALAWCALSAALLVPMLASINRLQLRPRSLRALRASRPRNRRACRPPRRTS